MKLINSFCVGLLLSLSILFTIFVGIKINYFDYYAINEFFNVIFVDNINFYILLPISIALGYLLLYFRFKKFIMVSYLICLMACVCSWSEYTGKQIGEFLFMSKPYEKIITYNNETKKIKLITMYKGRDKIYLRVDGTNTVFSNKK
ncbi:putative membrane protein [Campylobacter pinnipediorum subsp. caledonicus]|uniref:hypothetical protein n=1 Tax=Campylobacter pinnipediorum TaxID=1965231 RepID=UPI000994DE8F|nr:hypothetical protein [Campylobacter pinnipediorum]AQW85341.1 putative membrane protein [Campylobacter pinnipediorum subsp. caledonicus]